MDQPAPTVPPAVVTPSRTNRLLFFLVGVLIFASGIGIGLVVGKYLYSPIPTPTPVPTPIVYASPTPSSNPTASWKTYTKENAFSIRYPQNWFLIDDLATVYIGPNTDVAKSTDNYIVISTSLPGAFGTPEELKKQGYQVEETKTIVGGKEISRLYLTNPTNIPKLDYKQLVQVEISYTGGALDFRTSNTQLFDEFDQILSTFKFVN